MSYQQSPHGLIGPVVWTCVILVTFLTLPRTGAAAAKSSVRDTVKGLQVVFTKSRQSNSFLYLFLELSSEMSSVTRQYFPGVHVWQGGDSEPGHGGATHVAQNAPTAGPRLPSRLGNQQQISTGWHVAERSGRYEKEKATPVGEERLWTGPGAQIRQFRGWHFSTRVSIWRA